MNTRSCVLIIAITLCSQLSAQTSRDFLRLGIEKHNAKDFTGAIADYTKAIELDSMSRDAFYNRGVCALATKDADRALVDFTRSIHLDSTFAPAYYSRATAFVTKSMHAEALPDLDRLIVLDQKFPNALTLRGQLRMQRDMKKEACDDFHTAKLNGDKNAEKYLQKYCEENTSAKESLQFSWPENEQWKVGDDQENDKIRVVDWIPVNETVNKWTQLVNVTTVKGAKGVNIDTAMAIIFSQAKSKAPAATLTFLEKNLDAQDPWIIFTVEAPQFENDVVPESQLWYVVQGHNSLYTCFRAVKSATIEKNLRDSWTAFFKKTRIVRE